MIYDTISTESHPKGDLDINLVNDYRVFPVQKYVVGTIQGIATGAWATAVVTIERSNDGKTWAAMPTATTLTAEGFTGTLDVSGIAYLRARTTTAEGSASRARFVGCFKGDTP